MGPGLRPSSLLTLAVLLSGVLLAGRGLAATVTCDDNNNQHLPAGDASTDLLVTGPCEVKAGTDFTFHNVNIYSADPVGCAATNPPSCGKLYFDDDPNGVNFYAESVIVENGGTLSAGSPTAPIGTTCSGGKCGTVTIHLWGAETDPGATCKADTKNQCGIPDAVWTSNTLSMNPTSCKLASELTPPVTLPGNVDDCFYPYEPLDPADEKSSIPAYFGHKVLAVSYGGTLQLFGEDGATYSAVGAPCDPSEPSCSGTSWARLNGSVKPRATSMTIDRAVHWKDKDHIVITTTDYLPGHSEELIIDGTPTVNGNTTTIKFTNADPKATGIKWPHNGKSIDLSNTSYPGISRLSLNITKADTRAAVGLLTRSIQIVSQGDTPTTAFPAAPTDGTSTGYYFGGHTLVRQGLQTYQVQGAEFRDLGQGGEKTHYAVHFHMARKTPQENGGTFVKDSSVWDSMTRWMVIHGTQGVLLARNVGYESIGHGFYLEDGSETGNKLYSNLGVLARAAVANMQNPRRVPGILTAGDSGCNGSQSNCRTGYGNFPFYSDANYPAVFWIMNGMNDFEYNFGAGAGTCGACYWFVPGAISGPSRMEKWFGYASEQRSVNKDDDPHAGFDDRAGTTPLEKFIGNTCTSAMNSFQEVGNTSDCYGVNFVTRGTEVPDSTLLMLSSDRAKSDYPPVRATDLYWPIVGGGGRRATICPAADNGNAGADCSTDTAAQICSPGNQTDCDVTVLDRYTTSFNWAQKNFSAIWMRPFWSLVIDSVITDPQAAGLNFVTSGDYSKASVPSGFWALARKSVFIGSTQWQNPKSDLSDNPYASSTGPFNPFKSADGLEKGLSCALDPFTGAQNNSYCLSKDGGIAMQLEQFTNFQRLFSVYDGPAYQDSNAYLNIQPTYLTDDGSVTGKALGGCKPDACGKDAKNCNPCANLGFKDASLHGVRADRLHDRCYLPNAAIGWKQSNGFYYAPAFHSTNLYFNGVPIRHFVTEPFFKKGLLNFDTDTDETRKEYCEYTDNFFSGFTDIDRETVLNDDDGTLTGLTSPVLAPAKTGTISVNKESFFDAPTETPECASELALNSTGDAKCPPNSAKTSPYEYLTTALYPECALALPPKATTCVQGGKDTWGRECATSPPGSPISGCVGVPMFRQLLLPSESEGQEQMKRMMGQGTYQRSGLTVNHGVYYIDTTVSRDMQDKAGAKSFNVFMPGQKYDLYFLYANKNTEQTYQLFVGRDLSENFGHDNVKFGYVDINTNKYKFSMAKPPGLDTLDKNSGDLPDGWHSDYTSKDGILTLTVNMASLADEFDFSKNDTTKKPPVPLGQEFCQPKTMCAWNAKDSQCQCVPSSPYYDLCNQQNPSHETICSWSVKALDCPAQGCPALQITFPSDHFEAKGQHERPKPSDFNFAGIPNTTPFNWNIGFNLEDSSISGADCHYTQQPPLTCAALPTAKGHKKHHRRNRASRYWSH
jgi:cell migration-inducing and hyaluronan-binding protein